MLVNVNIEYKDSRNVFYGRILFLKNHYEIVLK